MNDRLDGLLPKENSMTEHEKECPEPMEELVEKIAKKLWLLRRVVKPDKRSWSELSYIAKQYYLDAARDILSDPSIIEVDTEAELPENPYQINYDVKYELQTADGYMGEKYMNEESHNAIEEYQKLLAKWVKPKE